jgi:hypothetical protein
MVWDFGEERRSCAVVIQLLVYREKGVWWRIQTSRRWVFIHATAHRTSERTTRYPSSRPSFCSYVLITAFGNNADIIPHMCDFRNTSSIYSKGRAAKAHQTLRWPSVEKRTGWNWEGGAARPSAIACLDVTFWKKKRPCDQLVSILEQREEACDA